MPEIARAPIGSLEWYSVRVFARGKQPNRRVNVGERRTLARDLLFKVVDVAAYLGALRSQCGDNVRVCHPIIVAKRREIRENRLGAFAT